MVMALTAFDLPELCRYNAQLLGCLTQQLQAARAHTTLPHQTELANLEPVLPQLHYGSGTAFGATHLYQVAVSGAALWKPSRVWMEVNFSPRCLARYPVML